MRRTTIGLLGLGVVGSGLYRAFHEEEADGQFDLRRVLVRDVSRQRGLAIEEGLLTVTPAEVVDDPAIEVVVEVMGGVEPARSLVARALANGKHVVTANKEMLARCGPELAALANRRGLWLGVEASVGGAVPVVAALRQALAGNRVWSLQGIVNGTTNYIISRMEQEGADFGEALQDAQRLGYAEPDPTNDIEGFDSRYKLCVLTALVVGGWPEPEQIACNGISKLRAEDFEFAWQHGYTIRLLASADFNAESPVLQVAPTFVSRQSPLAGVSGPFNAVSYLASLAGEGMLYGRGAGAAPTASALLADLYAINRGEPPQPLPEIRLAAVANRAGGSYYLRVPAGAAATLDNLADTEIVGRQQAETMVMLLLAGLAEDTVAEITKLAEMTEGALLMPVESKR